MVTPEPSSHDAGSAGAASVAKVLVNGNAPAPTAVAVAQASFAGAGVDVLNVNEYSLRVSVARNTRMYTVFPALGHPKAEIARLLGISGQSLYDILAGEQPVTPTTAVKLGKLCGNGLRPWMNMQTAYDLWAAEQEVDVSAIPTLRSA